MNSGNTDVAALLLSTHWLLPEKHHPTPQGRAADGNKSEDVFENAEFHSPSSGAEEDKLPIVTHPAPPHILQ